MAGGLYTALKGIRDFVENYLPKYTLVVIQVPGKMEESKIGQDVSTGFIVLGNLIDNAFEAVEKLPSDQRKVEVELTKDLMGYVFIVRNYACR
ncbi:GHKL domain-containing protein [Carboxydothermus pertinax]|uniref:GHKL domain-containing protein n=1 Tax=Carboxydothermus pertinax TaxID=870242 RepID=UPI00096A2531|nr:GHKL domain-containing protein [Carboxydothermus pertinax]